MGADGGGRGEAARRSGDLLSTRRRWRVRGTGTVSGGLAGAPSLALETLGAIFFFFSRGGAKASENWASCAPRRSHTWKSCPSSLKTLMLHFLHLGIGYFAECALEKHHPPATAPPKKNNTSGFICLLACQKQLLVQVLMSDL